MAAAKPEAIAAMYFKISIQSITNIINTKVNFEISPGYGTVFTDSNKGNEENDGGGN